MTAALGSRNSHAVVAASFMVAALVLGGGGSPSPTNELVLQIVFLVVALAWFWLPDCEGRVPRPRSMAAWALAAVATAVPLLQLIPLPPAIWHSLPGQEDRLAALALIDAQAQWRPLSQSPSHTLAGLLAIVPAVAAMIGTASLDRRGRQVLVATVAAMALATALLGAVQLSLGPAAPRLYTLSNDGVTGFQANKNAAADVLLIGLLAVTATFAPFLPGYSAGSRRTTNSRAAWPVLAGAMAVLILATALTNSRAGLALMPVALSGAWLLILPAVPRPLARRWPILLPLAVVAVIFGISLVAAGDTALGPVLRRFSLVDPGRGELWRDAWFALTRSWPGGIGVGGAGQALVAAERLEVVDPSAPNRVHNDYLEFLLEGGVAALVVLLVGVALLVAAARRSWRQREDRSLVVVGATIIAIVALHSFVDYPLRSMALACVTGMAAGLLFPFGDYAQRGPGARNERGTGGAS